MRASSYTALSITPETTNCSFEREMHETRRARALDDVPTLQSSSGPALPVQLLLSLDPSRLLTTYVLLQQDKLWAFCRSAIDTLSRIREPHTDKLRPSCPLIACRNGVPNWQSYQPSCAMVQQQVQGLVLVVRCLPHGPASSSPVTQPRWLCPQSSFFSH